MKNKYCSTVSRHLKCIAEPGVEGRDYVSSYLDFIDLFEQLDEAANAGVVSAAQRDAIQAVFACIDKVAEDLDNGLVGFNVYNDAHLRDSPTWEPMRVAARAAIKELEG